MMENAEEVMQLLEEFTKSRPKEIPRELEDYLAHVAKTGDPVFQWSLVKNLFREKLILVITEFYESTLTVELPPCPNVEPFSYERMKASLLERFDAFVSAPFTVQRICELLTNPRKEYNRADKYMRAIEKNILVVSTREPGSGKRPFESDGPTDTVLNGLPEMKLSDGSLLHIPTDLPYLGAPPASNDVTVETSELTSTRQENESLGSDVNGESLHIHRDTNTSKPWETQEPSKPIFSNEGNECSDSSSETCEVSRPNTIVTHSSEISTVSEGNNQSNSESDSKLSLINTDTASNDEDQTQPMPCMSFDNSSTSSTSQTTHSPCEIDLPDTGSISSVDSSEDCVDIPVSVGLGLQLNSKTIVAEEELNVGAGSDENEVSSTPANSSSNNFVITEVDETTNSEAEATDGNSVQCSDSESISQDIKFDLPDNEVNSSERVTEINETENVVAVNEVSQVTPTEQEKDPYVECNESDVTGMPPIITSPVSPNVSNVDSQGEEGNLNLIAGDDTSSNLEEIGNEQRDSCPDSSDEVGLQNSSTVVNVMDIPKFESCSEADSASNTEVIFSDLQKTSSTCFSEQNNSENLAVSSGNISSPTINLKTASDDISQSESSENHDVSSNLIEDRLVDTENCENTPVEEELKPAEHSSTGSSETAEVLYCQEKREESVIHSLSSVGSDNSREIITIEEISVDPSCETEEEEAMDVDDTSNQMMVSEGENEGEPMDQSDQQHS